MSLEKLFEGVEISEEAKASIAEAVDAKATELSEAKVAEAVQAKELAESELAELKEGFDAKVEESVNERVESLEESLDTFLTQKVNEWAIDNAVAIEAGTKVSIAESLYQGMGKLLAENNILLDEQQAKAITELEESVESLIAKLDEAKAAENKAITESKELSRQMHIVKATAHLTESQVEKVKELVANESFEDGEQFGKLVESVIEKHIKIDEQLDAGTEVEQLVEDVDGDKLDESETPAKQEFVFKIA